MNKSIMGICVCIFVGGLWAGVNELSEGDPLHDHQGLVVFEEFPHEAHDFRSDVQPLMESIIKKHGEQEWQIVVLTNEFHRHLGIYSIMGAKMGLAARDHFGVGLDEMTVLSFAGHKPPISCLNDGLQVSTGATLGHGTISIAENSLPCPKAQFTHQGSTLALRLKDTYWNQIKQDIKQIIAQHGLATPAYWQAVRKQGLTYWQQWSRNDLFE